MAWTTPLTAASNTALTAAQWNASVRDNLNMTGPALASASGQLFVSTAANTLAARTPSQASITTSQTTASTSFVNLTTTGPVVSVTTGTQAIAMATCGMAQDTSGGFCNASYGVSGATTIATPAAGVGSLHYRASAVPSQWGGSFAVYQTGLTSGSNTFTMQYNAGNNGGNATFFNRMLTIIPL